MKYFLIALLCIGLNVTNPSKTDFIEFASTHIKNKYPDLNFKPETNANELEKISAGVGNTMVTNFLTESTTQKDYWILSVFEVDMKLARDFGVKEKNIKVIGILDKFIPMPDLKSDEWQIIFK